MKLKSKARLRLELEAAGISHKALAWGAGISEPQLCRYMADHCQDDMPSYKIPAVTRELGAGYMEWMALQCGGVYHHGEQGPAAQPVTVLIGLLARQSGTSIQQLIQALEDREWSPKERQADLPGLRKLKTIVEALISEAEGGAR